METLENFLSELTSNMTMLVCAIVLAAVILLLILRLCIRVKITYRDRNDTQVIAVKKHRWLSKAPLFEAFDNERTFLGWTDVDGKVMYVNQKKIVARKSRTLYAVWDDVNDLKALPQPEETLTLTISYRDESNNLIKRKTVNTDFKLIDLFDEEDTFLGWSTDPNGENLVSDNTVGLEVNLYTSFKKDEEVVEEPVEEPVEEVVEEPVEEVVEEPVEEPVAEEEVVEEVVEEVEDEPAPEVADEEVEDVASTYTDDLSGKFEIRYSRSFTANITQAEDSVKDFYSELKNYILSYKGVKSRISWKYDSYNRGRDQLFKIKLRGKTICMYCALNPSDFDEARYHHEAVEAKIFEDVPMLIKIKSNLGLRKAKEIVDAVMARFEIVTDENAKTVDYAKKYPYRKTETLIKNGYIKELTSQKKTFNGGAVGSSELNEADEEPAQQEENDVVNEVVAEEVVTEPVEEAVEEPIANEPVEEPAEEVATEEAAQESAANEPVEEEVAQEEVVAEEPAEEVATEEPAEEEPVGVSAEEADSLVSDDDVIEVGEDVEYITKGDTKKETVNIDTLSKEFHAGDVVCLETLKAKKLINPKTKSIKVLARGNLNKPLTIKAGEFSKVALKMIQLTGGTAIHSTYVVK